MRILLLAPMVPQADGLGAIPKLLHAEVQGLTARHEVTLLAPFGDLPAQAEAAASLAASGLDAHFVDGRRPGSFGRRWQVRRQIAGSWLRHPWPYRAVSLVRGMQQLLDAVAAEREFDIVAVEDSAMAMLRLPPEVPRVLTEHEAARADAGGWAGGPLWQRPLRALQGADWKRLESFQEDAWQRFDLLQTFTRADSAEISRREPGLASRLRVNPYGLELPAAADRSREEPGLILFAGTFTHLPNRDAAHWLAAEILPAVRECLPSARLRLVGSAPPPEVRALAGPGVEVVADAPAMDEHLAAAAVILAPVRSGGGMRMKVLEAMALGKAVVTTPLGAEGFTSLDPRPPLEIAADGDGLAAAIAALLGQADRRHRLGAEARAFAERHHSPAAWAARLEAVYREAAELHSRRSAGVF